MGNDMQAIGEFLDDTPISDDDKLALIEEAKENFEKIPGVEFKNQTEDEFSNINNDFGTAREVIIKNINRLERLTSIVFDNIAIQPDNIMTIQVGKDCIATQNQNLKMLSELKNKTLQNKQIQNKIDDSSDNPKKPGNNLPDGFTLK
jgi:esterase/lipase